MQYFDLYDRSNEALNRRTAVENDFVQRFQHCLHTLEVPGDYSAHLAAILWQAMSNPLLRYHTPVHILFIVDFAKQHGIELHPSEELAIWFHDSSYHPFLAGGVNEHHSALLMEAAIVGPHVDPQIVGDAKAMILATGEHFSASIPENLQRVVDLDVAHFSLPRAEYQITTRLLRLEYQSISDEAFDAGRKDFLTKFLAKGFIYRSPFFQKNFAESAQANIRKDLEELA